MLTKTTAQKKILGLKKRVRIVQGGTSSSKTFSIIPLLIQYAIDVPLSEISIVSESIPHLKRGALKDFIKIMIWTGNFRDANLNKSDLKYRFSNGSYIEFFSVDQPDKLRGARRDVLFINEANNVTFDAYQQLAIRTKKFIYLDYNPTSEFWAHKELMNDVDSDFVILTYKDNEALDISIVKEIEKAREKAKTSKYWANWWNVYGLGLVGSLEGVVFEDWEQIDFIPDEARLIGYGMDFGYTNDPTTLIACYKYNDSIIFDECIYQKGLMNSDIANLIRNEKPGVVYADSAEPKSIDELRRYRLNVRPATKGKDSIMYGISLLQEKTILITKRSTNIIKELRNYRWAIDKEGNKLNKPIDAFNHAIDAMRYLAVMEFNNKRQFTRVIV